MRLTVVRYRKNYMGYDETLRKEYIVDKIEMLKKAVTFVVGVGTAKIVRDVIKNNVDVDTLPSQVTVTAASAAIGGAVSDLTKQYTDTQIDELVLFVQKIRNRKNENSEEI